MFSFDLVSSPSMEAQLVYGLAGWRNKGQVVDLRGWRRVPGCPSSPGTALLLSTRALGAVKGRLLPACGMGEGKLIPKAAVSK